MAFGEISEDAITCPGCGSQWFLTTGKVKKGPAEKPLKKYKVIIAGKDEIVVE